MPSIHSSNHSSTDSCRGRVPLLAALALAATLGACTTTGGSGGTSTVPAGRSTQVGFLSVFNPQTCTNARLPTARIVQPANGTVVTRARTDTFGASDLSARNRKCAGSQVRGLAVVYTPNAGYRGPDQFVLRVSYEQRTGVRSTSSQTYRVNVQ